MTGYMVPGSPYLTFEFANATPLFTSGQGQITSFNGTSVITGGPAGKFNFRPHRYRFYIRYPNQKLQSVSFTGSKFTVVNSIGTYIIYSLSGSLTLSATATGAGGTVVGSNPFTGVLRVVKLNNTLHEALLDQYVANYPTGVTTDYTFTGDLVDLTFTWAVMGTPSNLLMLTWPHHRWVHANGPLCE
jgi:endo-1,3(4)-beta-glucanase